MVSFAIVFTAQSDNPAINAIEIVPQAEDATGEAPSATTIRIKAGQSTPFTDSSGQEWQSDQGFEGGSFGGMIQGRGGFGQRGFGIVAAVSVEGDAVPQRATPRPSPSTSTGSGNTCSSSREPSSALRRPMGLCSGNMTDPPIGWASIAPRPSTRMAWCLPPQPTEPAAGQ